MTMHDGELHIDVALVQQLLAEQFPERAGAFIREVESTGTVNAIYRVGEDACARLPRLALWQAGLQREARWLPWLGERLSLPIPQPIGGGRPNDRYPLSWALYRWIDGEPSADGVVDEPRAARDLARFVLSLRQLDPSGAPPAGRRPLRQLDEETRAAIEAGRALIDADAALADDATWRRARGFALHQAAIAIPYYVKTNPGFAALAQRTIEQVVREFAEG